MVSVSSLSQRPQEAERPARAEQAEIDLLMRRFFEQSQGEPVDRPKPVHFEAPTPIARAPRDFDMATELLDRASKAFELLIGRCQSLEHDLDQQKERARAQAAEQGDAIEQWKRLASGLKVQAEASDQAMAALRQRCEAAEARAVAAEMRAADLERASTQAASQAALAEQLSTKLHDKVVVAFGIGSRAHSVLEAVATQAATR